MGPQLDDLDAKIVFVPRRHAMVITPIQQETGLLVGVLQLHGMPEDDDPWFCPVTGWPVSLNDTIVHRQLYGEI
jgi:hypothetical protein